MNDIKKSMQLETSVVMLIGVVFVSLISFSIFRVWNETNSKSLQIQLYQKTKTEIEKLEEDLSTAQTAAKNWKSRYRKAHRDYDLEVSDEDADDLSDIDPSDHDSLSQIAKIVYPNLPPALGKIIDSDSFQQAIVKTATKNPEGIMGFLEKIIPSDKPKESEVVGI